MSVSGSSIIWAGSGDGAIDGSAVEKRLWPGVTSSPLCAVSSCSSLAESPVGTAAESGSTIGCCVFCASCCCSLFTLLEGATSQKTGWVEVAVWTVADKYRLVIARVNRLLIDKIVNSLKDCQAGTATDFPSGRFQHTRAGVEGRLTTGTLGYVKSHSVLPLAGQIHTALTDCR